MRPDRRTSTDSWKAASVPATKQNRKSSRYSQEPIAMAVEELRDAFSEFRASPHTIGIFPACCARSISPAPDRGASRRVGLRGRGQSDGGFGRKIEEGKRFLQIKTNVPLRVTQVADGDILADMKVKVAAAGGHDEGAVNRGRPDDFAFDQAFDVFKNGIAVIAGFGEFGISVSTEQNRIGAMTPTRRSWLKTWAKVSGYLRTSGEEIS